MSEVNEIYQVIDTAAAIARVWDGIRGCEIAVNDLATGSLDHGFCVGCYLLVHGTGSCGHRY